MKARTFTIGDIRLAVAHFKVQVEAVSGGDGTLGHIDAHACVRRLEYAAVRVEYAVGARYYRTVAVRVERELAVDAVVVVMCRVGGRTSRWGRPVLDRLTANTQN